MEYIGLNQLKYYENGPWTFISFK